MLNAFGGDGVNGGEATRKPVLGEGLRCGAVFIDCSPDEVKTLWVGLVVCEKRLDNLAEFFLRGVRAGGNVFDLYDDFTDGRFQ